MARSPDLSGLRVLVVEDVFLIADAIAAQLDACGCDVVGPVPSLLQASALARGEALDGALLDVNLGDDSSIPVADILRSRAIPVIFLTGYGREILPAPYRDAPCLMKPFDFDLVARMVGDHFRH